MWPTWCRGTLNQPGTRWMFASYSERVSTRDSLARRTLLSSQWYLNHWGPRVRLIADQNQKTIFQNTARGHMLATTMGGQGTGLGGQILVIDDPHDTEKIISEKERQRGLHNFDHKLYTRLDDRKLGAIVVVMQRLHTKDLSGHLSCCPGPPSLVPVITILLFGAFLLSRRSKISRARSAGLSRLAPPFLRLELLV
jgi:hypothetical protein